MESLKKLEKSIRVHLSDNRRGERLRNGVQIAIIGEPNAGKSSLLNILCEYKTGQILSSIELWMPKLCEQISKTYQKLLAICSSTVKKKKN